MIDRVHSGFKVIKASALSGPKAYNWLVFYGDQARTHPFSLYHGTSSKVLDWIRHSAGISPGSFPLDRSELIKALEIRAAQLRSSQDMLKQDHANRYVGWLLGRLKDPLIHYTSSLELAAGHAKEGAESIKLIERELRECLSETAPNPLLVEVHALCQDFLADAQPVVLKVKLDPKQVDCNFTGSPYDRYNIFTQRKIFYEFVQAQRITLREAFLESGLLVSAEEIERHLGDGIKCFFHDAPSAQFVPLENIAIVK